MKSFDEQVALGHLMRTQSAGNSIFSQIMYTSMSNYALVILGKNGIFTLEELSELTRNELMTMGISQKELPKIGQLLKYHQERIK